jgi:hypothetical protein
MTEFTLSKSGMGRIVLILQTLIWGCQFEVTLRICFHSCACIIEIPLLLIVCAMLVLALLPYSKERIDVTGLLIYTNIWHKRK